MELAARAEPSEADASRWRYGGSNGFNTGTPVRSKWRALRVTTVSRGERLLR